MDTFLSIILCIICIIFLILLLILFIPFRYQGNVQYEENFTGDVKVSFFLFCTTFCVHFQEKQLDVSGHIAWIFPYSLDLKKSNKKKQTNSESSDENGNKKFSLERLKNIISELKKSDAEIKELLVVLKKTVLCVLPKKIHGDVTFGFEDPSETGRILGYISMFYPIFMQHVTVTPNFNEKVLKGHLAFKGRIILVQIIWIVLPVLFSKSLRNTIRRLKNV